MISVRAVKQNTYNKYWSTVKAWLQWCRHTGQAPTEQTARLWLFSKCQAGEINSRTATKYISHIRTASSWGQLPIPTVTNSAHATAWFKGLLNVYPHEPDQSFPPWPAMYKLLSTPVTSVPIAICTLLFFVPLRTNHWKLVNGAAAQGDYMWVPPFKFNPAWCQLPLSPHCRAALAEVVRGSSPYHPLIPVPAHNLVSFLRSVTGLPHITLRQLRRARATSMSICGCTPDQIQATLGHTSGSSQKSYVLYQPPQIVKYIRDNKSVFLGQPS